MEQHEFDKQFRKKLKEREIKPSADSWERLGQKLDEGERKRKTGFWRAGIAASLVAALLAGNFFLSGEIFKEEPQITDHPNQDQTTPIAPAGPLVEISVPEAFTEPEGRTRKEAGSGIINRNEGSAKATRITETRAAELGVAKVERDELRPGIQEAHQNETALAETGAPAERIPEVTDDEIDALLRNATLKISAQDSERITQNIRAEDLLEDVELELEQTFRRKVLEVLQEGFLKAKTAVANRNP